MCVRRRRRLLIYPLFGTVVFIGVYYVFLRGQQNTPGRHRHNKDFDVWPVGLPRRTERPLKPIPILVPQIHVKEIPPILVSPDMSHAEAEENFFNNMIGKIQEKHAKYAVLAFEMSRLHPKYTVARLPIVLGAFGLVPLGADQESARVLHREYSPSDTLGNAEGCGVGESTYSPERSRFLENKDVKCNNDQRLGNQHDGGWNVCMSPPMGLVQPCLVYSFGIGTDWQFDDAVSKIYGCRVLAYDPSINIRAHNRSALIQFQELGIAPKNFETPAGWQMKTLAQFLKDNRHQNTYINYLKFDIEYSEWKVIEAMLAEGSLRNVKQIGFEMHSRELFKVSKIDLPTGTEDFVRMYQILRKLELHNFRKFNYRKNPFGEYKSLHTKKMRSCCYELHYVNMNLLKPNETIVHTKDAQMFH